MDQIQLLGTNVLMYNDGKFWSKEHSSNKIVKIRNVFDFMWKKN